MKSATNLPTSSCCPIKKGETILLGLDFNFHGPQSSWGRRFSSILTMLATGAGIQNHLQLSKGVS
jgi:hypothetical protein